MIAMKNVLVATDFGEASHAALRYGRELAQRFGAALHVLHVSDARYAAALGTEMYVPLPDVEREAEQAARRHMDAFLSDVVRDARTIPVVIDAMVPAQAIVDYAADREIDLIVMGTHGRGPFGHLMMGSVAERVVRTAPCPVLTVKEAERDFVAAESPVATHVPQEVRA